MNKKSRIAIVGLGNLGWNLLTQLHEKGFKVKQVIAKSSGRNQKLAKKLDVDLDEKIDQLKDTIEIVFLCIPDDAIKEVASSIKRKDVAIVHCSGNTPLISGIKNPTGVFYPFQTFTKYFPVEWEEIPIFIESKNEELKSALKKIAQELSNSVFEYSIEKRKALHLAGVFGANFTNHLLYMAKSMLEAEKIPFDVMRPLVTETIRKAFDHGPAGSQTGPARRSDKKVIKEHLDRLSDEQLKAFYDLFTQNIQREYQ